MNDYTLTDSELVTALRDGAVGVLPTDTLYGVVCSAANPTSVDRLYAAKQRDGKPGTIIAADIGQLTDMGLKHRYLKAVEEYWPGPLSVIIPCGQELAYMHQGTSGLAVRIPDDEALLKLLRQTGPLLTSSANLTGQAPAMTVASAKAYFGDGLDFYVDGGDLSGRQPSTIIRIVDDAIEIVRPGAVTINENGRLTD